MDGYYFMWSLWGSALSMVHGNFLGKCKKRKIGKKKKKKENKKRFKSNMLIFCTSSNPFYLFKVLINIKINNLRIWKFFFF